MVILAGAGRAEVALRQRIGRGLRAKKKGPNVCFIVDIDDDFNNHLINHAAQRRAIVLNTPGFNEGWLTNFLITHLKKKNEEVVSHICSNRMRYSSCRMRHFRGLPMQVVGGNRSAGIVNVGFYHQGAPLLDGGEDADWTSAPYIAEQTCKKWGYAGAEQLNQLAHTQGFFNGYGFLLRGTVYQKFQCISNQPIARP